MRNFDECAGGFFINASIMNGDWSFQAEKKKKILAIKIPSNTFPQTKLSHYFIRHI